MTDEQIRRQLLDFRVRQEKAWKNLVEPAKAAVLALKDAKLENCARRLDEALFELHVVEEEMTKWMAEHLEQTIDVIFGRGEK